MARDNLPAIVNENGVIEAKLYNAIGDLPNLLLRVGPRVAPIGSERFNRNSFDLHVVMSC
jgi:hypothetical protein